VVLLASLAAPSVAWGSHGSGLLVTFVARVCPTYTDITANRARNNIQESLQDLGEDTPYQAGELMDPAVEQAHQPNCKPIPGWTFTLGTGYISKAVSGPWGALSIVTSPFAAPSIQTKSTIPLLDTQGRPTGQSIAGAATVELTPEQAAIAAHPDSLWAQGGTTSDPILSVPFPGQYGFGALRCAIDNLNGDNVEWIGFPSGVSHVFCFAYYVQPPPTSGTIIIHKQIQAPAGTTESFPFEGNISFNPGGKFELNVASGGSAQEVFYRAETRPGDAPWSAREIVPANWRLTSLTCTSRNGTSVTGTTLAQASVSIALAPSDTVTCNYTDEYVPPTGGLLIRKVTHGDTGRFAFDVTPESGGPATSAVAETTEEGLAVDAQPGPLNLAPGGYTISETPPSAGWKLTGVVCNEIQLPLTQPIKISITAGQSMACTLTNTYTPPGAIKLSKVTVGGLATTGFVISPASGAPVELHQSATTTHEGKPALAVGEPTTGLALGRYLIQETTPEPAGDGHWELTSVQCGGKDVPFADGRASVTLSQTTPTIACTFTNTHRPKAPEPPGPEPAEEPKADLTVTKHALSTPITLGEPASFEVSVKNDGPDAAEEVVLDDQPESAATFVSAQPSQGSCSHGLPTTCLLGRIAAGHTVTIVVVVIPHHEGAFVNRAILGTATVDANVERASASARVHVKAAAPHPEPTTPSFTG